MRTFKLGKDGVLRVLVNISIMQAIKDALWLAKAKKCTVKFMHRDVLVNVESDSNSELLFRDWMRAIRGCLETKEVGPHPKPKLTKKDKAQDALLKARKGDYQVQKSRLVAALKSPRMEAHSVSS